MIAEGPEGKTGRQNVKEDTGFSVIHCGHLARKLKTQGSVGISLHPSLLVWQGWASREEGMKWGQPLITHD